MILLDTGDFYGMGDNELLIGEALRADKRGRVAISVKLTHRAIPWGWAGQDWAARGGWQLLGLHLAPAGH